jgi:transcriptional regulator with XRE-family HTH domain
MSHKHLTTYERILLEDERGLRQEELIIEVTEAVARALRSSGLTQNQLAARLGKTKGYISQVMAGGNNLTLRTLADIAQALGYKVGVNLFPEVRARGRLVQIDNWNHSPNARADEARASFLDNQVFAG